MSETNHDDLVDAIFEQFNNTNTYKDALQRAAEYVWRVEMDETNDKMTDVREYAVDPGCSRPSFRRTR